MLSWCCCWAGCCTSFPSLFSSSSSSSSSFSSFSFLLFLFLFFFFSFFSFFFFLFLFLLFLFFFFLFLFLFLFFFFFFSSFFSIFFLFLFLFFLLFLLSSFRDMIMMKITTSVSVYFELFIFIYTQQLSLNTKYSTVVSVLRRREKLHLVMRDERSVLTKLEMKEKKCVDRIRILHCHFQCCNYVGRVVVSVVVNVVREVMERPRGERSDRLTIALSW